MVLAARLFVLRSTFLLSIVLVFQSNQNISLNLRSITEEQAEKHPASEQVQIKVFRIITARHNSIKLKNTFLLFSRSVSNQTHACISFLPAHWPELIHQKDNLQCPGESPVLDQLQLRQKQSSDEVVLSMSKPSHLKLHLFTGANLKYQIYEILLQNKSQPFPVCDVITASLFLIQHLVHPQLYIQQSNWIYINIQDIFSLFFPNLLPCEDTILLWQRI